MKYWHKDKHDVYCRQWLSADTKQQYQLYNKLHWGVYQICTNILNRYYQAPPSYNTILFDCINHIFINLHNYKPELSAYSYVSALAKHYYHGVLVQPQVSRYYMYYTYVDSYDGIDDGTSMYEDREIVDKTALISILKKKLEYITTKHSKKNHLGYPLITRRKYLELCQLINLMIEYAEKFDTFQTDAVLDYIYTNGSVSPRIVQVNIRYLFNYAPLRVEDNLQLMKVKRSIVQDDQTDIELSYVKNFGRKRRKYPEIYDYM